jgi:hypothetical protein
LCQRVWPLIRTEKGRHQQRAARKAASVADASNGRVDAVTDIGRSREPGGYDNYGYVAAADLFFGYGRPKPAENILERLASHFVAARIAGSRKASHKSIANQSVFTPPVEATKGLEWDLLRADRLDSRNEQKERDA